MHHDIPDQPPAQPYFLEHPGLGAAHDFLTQILHPDLLAPPKPSSLRERPFSFDLP